MDAKKDSFTNEKISKKFVSLFDLVNYAIRLAENMIKTGREPRVKTEYQNRSMQILAEITEGKDLIDEVYEEIDVEGNNRRTIAEEKMATFSTQAKSVDKKKNRRIFND